MPKKYFKKGRALSGFTIVELAVVVIIIVILAVIVVANVSGYGKRADNASVKENLNSLMANFVMYSEANSGATASGFISSAGATIPIAVAQKANGGTAVYGYGSTVNQTWCVCSVIYNTGVTPDNITNGTYCTDSTGYKKVTASSCSTTRCLSTCTSASCSCSD